MNSSLKPQPSCKLSTRDLSRAPGGLFGLVILSAVTILLGLSPSAEGAVTLFDRTSGVNATSTVSVSHLFSGDAFIDRIAGTRFDLQSAFSTTKYSILVSSHSGTAYSPSFLIGNIQLHVYQRDGLDGSFDLVHTLMNGSASLYSTSYVNAYGDALTLLEWDMTGIDLSAGTYILSTVQHEPSTQSQAMYLNFVAPGVEDSLSMTAVSAIALPDHYTPTFEYTRTLSGGTSGLRHFADKLEGNAVPEPSRVILLGVGVAASILIRRRNVKTTHR